MNRNKLCQKKSPLVQHSKITGDYKWITLKILLSKKIETNIWEIPSKINGYKCTCASLLIAEDLGFYASIMTVEPKDIPSKKEDLIVYVAKMKCLIDILKQSLDFSYTINPNR